MVFKEPGASCSRRDRHMHLSQRKHANLHIPSGSRRSSPVCVVRKLISPHCFYGEIQGSHSLASAPLLRESLPTNSISLGNLTLPTPPNEAYLGSSLQARGSLCYPAEQWTHTHTQFVFPRSRCVVAVALSGPLCSNEVFPEQIWELREKTISLVFKSSSVHGRV